MHAKLARQRARPRFSAPITLVVMPEECQSIPITAPKDCQAPEPLVAAIMVDDRLADQRSETRHSIGQPLWHMPAMKRQISAARSLCHHSPWVPLAALLRSSGASKADRSGRFF
jgi:hypothetical protein